MALLNIQIKHSLSYYLSCDLKKKNSLKIRDC